MHRLVYKICPAEEWRDAEARGQYEGSEDDVRDGFVHLSTAEQLQVTAEKHFPGRTGLVLLALDAEQLSDALKWEPSRGGALFPHHYAPLPVSAVLWSEPLQLDEAARHVLPARARL